MLMPPVWPWFADLGDVTSLDKVTDTALCKVWLKAGIAGRTLLCGHHVGQALHEHSKCVSKQAMSHGAAGIGEE